VLGIESITLDVYEGLFLELKPCASMTFEDVCMLALVGHDLRRDGKHSGTRATVGHARAMHFLLKGDAVQTNGTRSLVRLPSHRHGDGEHLRWELRHLMPALNFSLTAMNPLKSFVRRDVRTWTGLFDTFGLSPVTEHFGRPATSLKRKGAHDELAEASDEFWVSTGGLFVLLLHFETKRRNQLDQRLTEAVAELIATMTLEDGSYDVVLLPGIDLASAALCQQLPLDSGRCACINSLSRDMDGIRGVCPRMKVLHCMRLMFGYSDCKSCAAWLGHVVKKSANLVDTRASEWGDFDPLVHPELLLVGPSGSKRRRLAKGFKDAVGLQAMEDKRSNTVSSMLKAVYPQMQKNCHRIVYEQLWEHKAATELAGRKLHVVHSASDGCRVGKPAREYLGVYLWFAREQLASCLPPVVFPCPFY
jgi:hypothetical protein